MSYMRLCGVTAVTRRQYYVRRATECIVTADRCPAHRATPMHMAATYVRMAIEVIDTRHDNTRRLNQSSTTAR
jgi:hypothetical protein